ncbi:GspH/FimT family pseudopilin [Pseudomonas sp. NA-150]|uniref:GspH/FimT family pseudopilin n=1 Tax=Pseudomonas sp. NA-150 TaxID=3367525 RepID=UPI0037C99015
MDFGSRVRQLEAQSRLRSPQYLDGTSAGFSLIELMIVVAIVAIFAAIAAPNFASILHKSSVNSAANELYDLLQYSRSEAVTRGKRVIITAPAGNVASWNGDITVSIVGSTVLRDIGAGGLRNGVAVAATVGSITFSPTGNASAAACFQVSYASDANVPTQFIAVQGSGRVTSPSTVAPATGECN